MSSGFFILSFLIASVLSLALHVALNSPISPLPLSLPTSHLTPNNLLQGVEKLGEGELVGPEDVVVGSSPELGGGVVLYTGTRDGWIKRVHENGSIESWRFVGGPGVLGIAASMDGSILVCDALKGLLKVGQEGVLILTSQVDDGSLIRFADEAIEALDGTIYITEPSDKFVFHDWFLDVLEAKPHGRLLKYDPSTKKTSVVLSNLAFANGVALSPNQDFLIVCETWRFRCLKYWLKGDSKGEVEIFVDNLPGGPDNINLAADGSFWIALLQLQMKSPVLNMLHRSTLAKRVMAALPNLLKVFNPMKEGAMAVKVATNGTIIKTLDDSDGSVMSFITTAVEFEGNLYLGNLGNDFIGKISI